MKRSSLRRKLINAQRVFLIGVQSFVRNTWLSVAATLVMMITLLSILTTIFASYTLNNTVASFTEKIDVSIFFKDSATKEQVDSFSEDLRANQPLEVKEVTYISKEDARASFEEENKDDIKTLQAIAQADDAFPSSVRVKTLDTEKLQDVVDFARQEEYKTIVDKDSYQDDAKRTAIDRLGNVAKFLRSAGLVASVIFGAISILVVLNTIRMAIFNRKDEIEIMQLIGASRWYIRGPFLVEAALYGAIAGLVASLTFFFVVLQQAPKLGDYVEEISPTIDRFNELIWLVLPAVVAVGVVIGAFSSYLAIRKHLRLKIEK